MLQDVRVVVDTAGCADAIAALATDGPLAQRTVIILHERAAHGLRRELIRTGRAQILAGTRFVSMLGAARAVLEEGGVSCEVVGARHRVTALGSVLRSRVALERFGSVTGGAGIGWDLAFAEAIDDLEAAGFNPSELESAASPQLRDVGVLWRASDALMPGAWSAARVLIEASVLLFGSPSAWPFDGTTLVTLAPSFDVAQARFATAVPRSELALFAARPIRDAYLDRVELLLGTDAAATLSSHSFDALDPCGAPLAPPPERAILAAHLFAPPDAPKIARPRSAGPDGTVALEEARRRGGRDRGGSRLGGAAGDRSPHRARRRRDPGSA